MGTLMTKLDTPRYTMKDEPFKEKITPEEVQRKFDEIYKRSDGIMKMSMCSTTQVLKERINECMKSATN